MDNIWIIYGSYMDNGQYMDNIWGIIMDNMWIIMDNMWIRYG